MRERERENRRECVFRVSSGAFSAVQYWFFILIHWLIVELLSKLIAIEWQPLVSLESRNAYPFAI